VRRRSFLIIILFLCSYSIASQTTYTVTTDYTKYIAIADKEYEWGSFQFPVISQNKEGWIAISWQIGKDAVEAYNKNTGGGVYSSDNGETWDSIPPSQILSPFGVVSTYSGEYLRIFTPTSFDVNKYKLKSIGEKRNTYSSEETYKFYKYDSLPNELKGVYFYRIRKGESRGEITRAEIESNPNMLRYSVGDYFPVVWWGNIINYGNELIAATYPYLQVNPKNKKIYPYGIGIYQSKDNGYNWKLKGVISYNLQKKEQSDKYLFGFSEPFIIQNKYGELVCVMRTTDGSGDKPIYLSISKNSGTSWSIPRAITNSGVFPRLLKLRNGNLILSTGRPGIQVYISNDGGYQWDGPIEILPDQSRTCGYTGLLEAGFDSFFIVYSDFDHINKDGDKRKAIVLKKITVKNL
jgi:hypothetical protein